MKLRKMTEEEGTTVDEFIAKYIYQDEPLGATVEPVDVPVAGKGFASAFAPQGLSLVAESDEGSIMGVCLNDKFPQSLPNIYSFSENDKKFQYLFDYLQEGSRVMEIAPDAMELRMLAVSPYFRKQGVTSKLVEESLSVAHEAGYSWAKIYCTSEYSSNMMANMGWTLLYSRSYKDLKEKVVLDLPIPPEPHTHINLYIKKSKN